MNIDSNKNYINYDVFIIGGGINGAGIARDAAGRGYKVMLCEKDDLAQHTSSASSKLIHGGLRYLETYDFGLVRKSLIERNILLNIAPHIIWPQRFIIPYTKTHRNRWLISAGLFIYDHLYLGNSLPNSRMIDLSQHDCRQILGQRFKTGFEYSDCWVQDSRLVVLNAVDAHRRKAEIKTHTKCTAIYQLNDCWQITLESNGNTETVKTRVLINATGPWVSQTQSMCLKQEKNYGVRLIRGSHIVVPKIPHHEQPFLLQHDDGRIVFMMPYEQHFSLIGTTDYAVDNPESSQVSSMEIDYLIGVVNQYLKVTIKKEDIVWHYAGIRPLFDDQEQNVSKITREYRLLESNSGPLMVSVYGGKVTTYRKLAEQVVNIIDRRLQRQQKPWTKETSLPGGEFNFKEKPQQLKKLMEHYPWLPPQQAQHYMNHYGLETYQLLGDMIRSNQLGEHFGAGLYQAEVEYLMNNEWAKNPDDFLWRRTKYGLHMSASEQQYFNRWFNKEAI